MILGQIEAVAQSKIVKNPQVHDLQELMDDILADKEKTERAGFEPRLVNPTQPFKAAR